jgi:aminopeptidase N
MGIIDFLTAAQRFSAYYYIVYLYKMNKYLSNLTFFLIFTIISLNLQAQTILSESDIEARRQFYKTELENRNLRYRQIGSSESMHSYDAVYYKLEFDIGIDPNSFSAKATEKFVLLSDSINSLTLDFDSYLTVTGISGDASSYELINYSLMLELDTTYTVGDTIEVIIEYQGIPRSDGDFAGFWYGFHREGPQYPQIPVVYTLSEPYGARSWWPCKDDPMDKPDSMDIYVTIPDKTYEGYELYAVSNGKLMSIAVNNDQTRTFHWHEQYPIASYLVSLAISNYLIYTEWYVTAENDSMPVTYYVYPEKYDDALIVYANTVDMIDTYSNLFGLYPFFEEKYGMANFGWTGIAMEHQTVSSMGMMNFWVVAHELAHQWFGNLVTCADFHHIWLNEGWATYLEALYAEKLHGKENYHTYMTAIAYFDHEKTIYIEEPSIDPIFDSIVYDKGAWVLHMLRHVMGDSLFFTAASGYLNDPVLMYQSATTEDFKQIMEQYYGSELDWFFSQWIYGKGYPIYDYSWTYEPFGNEFKIGITIEQVQSEFGSEEVFVMPLDIEIMQFPNLTRDTVQIWNNQRIQSFELISDSEPGTITIDPENWVLNRSEEVTHISTQPGALLYKYKMGQNYPNPFNPSTTIQFSIEKSEKVELTIYTLSGERVRTILSGKIEAGYHSVQWDGNNDHGHSVASGVYIYRIKTKEFTKSMKMLFLK